MERLMASDITERIKEEIIARGILPKDILSFCSGNRSGNIVNTASASTGEV